MRIYSCMYVHIKKSEYVAWIYLLIHQSVSSFHHPHYPDHRKLYIVDGKLGVARGVHYISTFTYMLYFTTVCLPLPAYYMNRNGHVCVNANLRALYVQMQEEEAKLLKEHKEQLIEDLKAAVQAKKEGRKMTHQTKPAIVLENREPPEIPEFKIEDAIASPFTGEEAVWYMLRLSLLSRTQKTSSDEEGERAVSGKVEDRDSETDGDVQGDVRSESNTQGVSEAVEESEEMQEKEQASSSGSGCNSSGYTGIK